MTADRDGYVKGLRMLADLLEGHPDLPLPYDGASPTYGHMSVYCETRAQVASYGRALPGRWVKHVDPTSEGYGFELRGTLAGLHLDILAPRDVVCQRVVTGTKTVMRQVPDRSAPVPLVEVEETVETVEWECVPLLSGVDAPAVTS